ncbi:hypothetical protein RI543_004631 [Arxiozyma heterogenica]|uniref:Uncharacterized protein n=1 Tax=Arxiozyma heterogenica TaxID=278026 RepID=A0AAN7WM56_9SACH|nr:hypothetical protein RI543_004631 [Kazachstania heterogenica]
MGNTLNMLRMSAFIHWIYSKHSQYYIKQILPFSSTNSKIFNKQTQQLLVTSQQLLLDNLSFKHSISTE